MWILILSLIVIVVLVLCLSKESYLSLKDKLFIDNGSKLDTHWREEEVYGANQYPNSMYTRKRFLGPGFYSTSNWAIAPREKLDEDQLPILGRWNDNSIKGAQKYYRVFY
jgi:hypothetical protein